MAFIVVVAPIVDNEVKNKLLCVTHAEIENRTRFEAGIVALAPHVLP